MITRLLLALYVVATLALFLWPYRFEVECKLCVNGAAWTDEPGALAFPAAGMAVSPGPVPALAERMAAGDGLAIEAWLTPATLEREGPARIVSYSLDQLLRNVTLGQQGADLVLRLRTTATDLNGRNPETVAEDVLVAGRRQHVVAAFDLREVRIFVDGGLKMASPLPAGELSTWAADHRLVLGNELTGDRPWLGRLERVVLYDRPLSPAEVAEHHAAGAPAAESAGAVADYRFAEGDGTRVRDHRGAYDLELPLAFVNEFDPELLDPAPRRPADLAASFAIFLPLGALAALAFGGPRPGTRAAAVAFLAAALVALIAESLQYYVADRTSSALDLLGAIAGALVGAAAPALAARR